MGGGRGQRRGVSSGVRGGMTRNEFRGGRMTRRAGRGAGEGRGVSDEEWRSWVCSHGLAFTIVDDGGGLLLALGLQLKVLHKDSGEAVALEQCYPGRPLHWGGGRGERRIKVSQPSSN